MNDNERNRTLVQAVLRHLTENGPTKFATLCCRFEDGSREIRSALGYLALHKYIAVDGTRLKITQLGTEQLNLI